MFWIEMTMHRISHSNCIKVKYRNRHQLHHWFLPSTKHLKWIKGMYFTQQCDFLDLTTSKQKKNSLTFRILACTIILDAHTHTHIIIFNVNPLSLGILTWNFSHKLAMPCGEFSILQKQLIVQFNHIEMSQSFCSRCNLFYGCEHTHCSSFSNVRVFKAKCANLCEVSLIKFPPTDIVKHEIIIKSRCSTTAAQRSFIQNCIKSLLAQIFIQCNTKKIWINLQFFFWRNFVAWKSNFFFQF